MRQGWICPKCSKGKSPDVQTCECFSFGQYQYQWGGGIGAQLQGGQLTGGQGGSNIPNNMPPITSGYIAPAKDK